MINETLLLLSTTTTVENYSEHVLSKYKYDYLLVVIPYDLYFYKPLQKIFSKVILYDCLKRMTEIGLTALNKEIIDLVRKEHPKYVLWISGGYNVQESTFDTIRKEGSIVVGWFMDDELRFDDYSKWWIPYLDYCAT